MFVSSTSICVNSFLFKGTVGIVLLQRHKWLLGHRGLCQKVTSEQPSCGGTMGTQGPDQRGHCLLWTGHWVNAGVGWEAEKMLCSHCSAIAKTSLLSTLFPAQIHGSSCDRNELCPSPNPHTYRKGCCAEEQKCWAVFQPLPLACWWAWASPFIFTLPTASWNWCPSLLRARRPIV